MKKVVEIQNVLSEGTRETGTLYLIGSVSHEAVQIDKVEHYGLCVFFRPEGKMAQYIKSYVLTTREVNYIRRGHVDVIRDLGYLLSVSGLTLDVMTLTNNVTKEADESQFSTQLLKRATFSLQYDTIGERKLLKEQKIKSVNRCGFQLAMQSAIGEYLNITDDSIVSSIFPGEASVDTYNYILED